MADPELLPTPAAVKALAAPLACGATGCGGAPLAQWLRRLTPDEYAAELAFIQAKWDAAFALRDLQLPDPVQPPMPDTTAFTRAVYACGPHALGLTGAAHVHQSTCSGPNSPNLPRCDCTPEPAPQVAKVEHLALMPDHWATAMAAGA